MGFATHLGPWLLGTVKETTAAVNQTNASNNLVRNTGATIVAQNAVIGVGSTTANTAAFVIPAGAMITSLQFITTTAFTAGTVSVYNGSTVIINGQTLPTALGVTAGTVATTGAAFCNNVGTTDQLVTFTISGATGTNASTTLVCAYVVRNSDGTSVPANP